MKRTIVWGILFSCMLGVAALSMGAFEGSAYTSAAYLAENNPTQQAPMDIDHPTAHSAQSTKRSPLDIVFVVGNALLGFLLLRKVNRS